MLTARRQQFDIVMADTGSPDKQSYQLLQDALDMGSLVILMSANEDESTARNAVERGAFLFIQKPIKMELLKYLWQHVLREKTKKSKGKNQVGKLQTNEGMMKNKGKEKKEGRALEGTKEGQSKKFRWYQELHDKFMDAVRELGGENCTSSDILRVMNVPGLTRRQVERRLQTCRNNGWMAPKRKIGSMPPLSRSSPVEEEPCMMVAQEAVGEGPSNFPSADQVNTDQVWSSQEEEEEGWTAVNQFLNYENFHFNQLFIDQWHRRPEGLMSSPLPKHQSEKGPPRFTMQIKSTGIKASTYVLFVCIVAISIDPSL